MTDFFKSIIDQDPMQIVICNLEHTILYMNPAAVRDYAKRGGEKLVGQSVLDCHGEHAALMIQRVVDWFLASPENNCIHTFFSEKGNADIYMVALRDENKKLIGYYEKHESRTKDEGQLYDMK